MKRFVLYPSSNVMGVLFDDRSDTIRAMFLTPQQAKFEAMYGGGRRVK